MPCLFLIKYSNHYLHMKQSKGCPQLCMWIIHYWEVILLRNVKTIIFSTLTCLNDLGFYIHPEKSIFTPTQEIIFLGYHINTLRITIALTFEKKQKSKGKVEELLAKNSTIREVSSRLDSAVASFEVVLNGRLHYRHIEFNKISVSKHNEGNFEAKCYLSPTAIAEMNWWKDNILQVYRVLKSIPEVD